MKKTILATVAAMGLMVLVALPAMAEPGQGRGGDEPAVFGQEGGGCGGAQAGGCACGGEQGGGCACGAQGGGDQVGAGCGCGCMGQGEGRHGMRGQGPTFWKCPIAKGELGLTDDVVAQMDRIHTDNAAGIQALDAEIKTMHDEMKTLFAAARVDVQKVKALTERIAAKKAEIMVIRNTERAQIMNLLTAEQRQKLDALHERMGHGGAHGGHGGHRGQGGHGGQGCGCSHGGPGM